jgi:3-hydroxy-9,10-secoandrosta-1,3,5(10)-triene-9,17-dione monooxygenase
MIVERWGTAGIKVWCRIRKGSSPMAAPLEGLLERIAELRPMLQQNATKTEENRQVVEENISALEDAGAFKIMVPKRYGGYEGTVKQKLQVSREVALGCGSTAWVTALQNVCAYFTGKMSKQCQDDVWGDTPDARIAGVLTPVMETRNVEGGIRHACRLAVPRRNAL